MRLGVATDGPIEAQRVVVGHKQCLVGLVLKHILFHLASLALPHIGRIADDDLPKAVVSRRSKDVGLFQHDSDLGIQIGISAGNGKGLRTDVPGRHPGPGQCQCQRQRYATGTRTDVEYGSGEIGRGIAACPLHQFRGFGARNEGTATNQKAMSAKEGGTKNVLDGFVM